MQRRSVIVLIGVLVFAPQLAVALQSEQPRVLFDEAHDELNTISEARAHLISNDHPEWYVFRRLAEGVSSEYRLERGLSAFESAFLEDFDVVVIATPRAPFSPRELDALERFVDGGGGLLVVQDANPPVPNGSNQVAELFGARFREGVLRSEHGDWDPETFRVDVTQSDHFLIQGFASFQMNWGCSIAGTPDCVVLLQSRQDTWQDSNGDRQADADEPVGPLPIAVAMVVGKGRVILIADNAFHDAVWDANHVLFLNALRWLSGTTAGVVAPGALVSAVDPDVKLDSVVQSGDGPQELTTAVKFYPNTRHIHPGETVCWTLDLGNLEGPFTIVPEMDNDNVREGAIQTSKSKVVISHTYGTANIYLPHVELRGGDRSVQTVFTTSVLGVVPDLLQRHGVGLTLPTPESPAGDYIKAMHILTFDYTLFGTAKGRSFLQGELDRLAGLGVNTVIYDVMWFCDDETSNVHEPIYGDAWPACWVGTLPLQALADLADWTHARGMRVGLRYFLRQKGDHSSLARARYSPSSDATYLKYQDAIKVLYASVCESLAIEIYCLDTENEAFTSNHGVVQLIRHVREVYGGAVTDGAYKVSSVFSCPFTQELDFVSWSDYHFGEVQLESEQLSQKTLSQAFLEHYSQDIRPVLEHVGKPGFVMETGVDMKAHSEGFAATQYRAYLEAMAQLHAERAPICGSAWWVWNLSDPQVEPYSPRGHSAEQVLSDYFGNVLPERVVCDFSLRYGRPPAVALVVADFNRAPGPELELWNQGGTFSAAGDRTAGQDGSSLRLSFKPSKEDVPFWYGFVWAAFHAAQDWSTYRTLSFWIKTDPALSWTHISVDLCDWDGDRFSVQALPKPYMTGWQVVSVRLDLLTQPDWAPRGDGVLDLKHIRKWGIGFLWGDNAPRTIWLDTVYLGR